MSLLLKHDKKYDKDAIKDEIIRHLDVYPDTSFASLEDMFGNVQHAEPDMLLSAEDPQLVIWKTSNKDMTDAVRELLDQGIIKMWRCDISVYTIDGSGLRLPLAKNKPPKGGYKTLHWLPVMIKLAKGKPGATAPRG